MSESVLLTGHWQNAVHKLLIKQETEQIEWLYSILLFASTWGVVHISDRPFIGEGRLKQT